MGDNGRFHFHIADHQRAHKPSIHYHEDFEVYYLCDGRCRYFIGEKTYHLDAGDIVVIPPGVIHKVIYESEIHSRLLFNCSLDCIPASVRGHIDELVYFRNSKETAGPIQAIYSQMRSAAQDRDEFTEDTLRCYGMQLFLIMARSSILRTQATAGNSFVEKALSYIHANYASRLTLSGVADHCAVSPEHLSRSFRKETGFGFSEYLNIYRLKKAESILKSGTAKSIAQVAFLCGFNDSNYFSNCYKKIYGTSPSAVKKQTKKEKDYVY